jgi:hypothetical protein
LSVNQDANFVKEDKNMTCRCSCNQAIDVIGLCDTTKIIFDGSRTAKDRNWTEISVPELLTIPDEKPDIEQIDKIFVKVKIISKRVVATPVATVENAEGTKLTGRKLIVEGIIEQKIVYTADVPEQSLHSAHFNIPFSAFIVLPKDVKLEDKFCVEVCVEDVFAKVFSCRDIFKNVTLFLRAVPEPDFTGCPQKD